MIKEAAMLTTSCVLFISMGLSDAVQDTLRFRLKVLSCNKCMTFWTVLLYALVDKCGIIQAIAVSFLCSYCSMWLSLAIDGMTLLYNKAYELISKTDASENEADSGEENPAEAGSNEVS